MPFAAAKRRAGVTGRCPRLPCGCGWTAWIACSSSNIRPCNAPSWCVRRTCTAPSVTPRLSYAFLQSAAQRHYTTSLHTAHAHNHNCSAQVDVDDWSTVEVEVLTPETVPASPAAPSSSSYATTTSTAETTGEVGATPSPTASIAAVHAIDAVDAYAKAKVINFIRRQQPPSQGGSTAASPSSTTAGGHSGSGGSGGGRSDVASSSSSSASIPGMEIREVQGSEGNDTQFHARWRLPLPAEYGERFGEGFAPTAKEAESVAAMHAERVIDALGFPLFLLSSKQRKHAEAARAAGRWATMPPASAADVVGSAAEIMPPPETPSPPPLRLVRMSAREQQERQLHIDRVSFAPVEKGVFAPLSCTLASPYYYDPASVRRIEAFFTAHRTSLSRCLRFFQLQGDHKSGGGAQQPHLRRPTSPGDVFLAQLTLPLPPRFGIRVAMGRGPTKKDAATLACMHAELIIDAVGFALYPTNHKQQAVHAEECMQVRRWCTPSGDCDYRYTIASPAPLELVEKLDDSAAVAAAAACILSTPPASIRAGEHETRADSCSARQQGHDTSLPGGNQTNDDAEDGRRANSGVCTDNAGIHVGSTSSGSVESILLQHHHAIAATSHFSNEVSMREYENARLLLERYLEQFLKVASSASPSSSSPSPSPLLALMFVERLGQRDRSIYRATITVPLVDAESEVNSAAHAGSTAAPAPTSSWVKTPLPYTQSFVAIGVADTSHVAELAASLHALRTLAALNRLTLVHGNPTIIQALQSFAARGQLPLYNPARPVLSPADVPPEDLPAAVRVMEGVIGRVATARLSTKAKEARAQVFLPGSVVQSRKGTQAMRLVEHHNVLCRHTREDFLLQELQLARSRLPRLDWDTTADAQNRIVVAPDANPQTARQYFHTLSSVRNPDNGVALRIRDYLERHGKTRDMVYTTIRARVSEEAPEEGHMFVTTLTLPLPELCRRRTREEDGVAAGEDKTAEKAAASKKGNTTPAPPPSTGASPSFPPTPDAAHIAHSERKTFVAQGEAPTREDSILLCDAHAELLLDALGVPLYDHSQLQCTHADAARALGRWAPLVRGALMAPAALRHLPPPLRKVRENSMMWSYVQRERHAAAAKARQEGSTSLDGAAADVVNATAHATAAAGGIDATACDVNDEALCDVTRLRFVHHAEIFHNSVRYAAKFFAVKGLDFYRAVRQYKVSHPTYGVVHRAIVELPTPPRFGKRYAVGLADTKRNAFHLCSQHTVHILDALHIPIHYTKAAQTRYAHKGAVKGQKVPLPSDGVAGPSTPTPPGYYSLELSEAASERPPVIPVCPSAEAAEEELVWKTYVQRCEVYRRRWTTYVEKRALSALPVPGAPRSQVPVEDATLDIAESTPLEPTAGRQLRDICSLAGLPNPLADRLSFEGVKLSAGKRVFVTKGPLYGTPYTMRGFSSEDGPASRQRAYMHGVQLVQHIVRGNSEVNVRARCGWAEGMDRSVSIFHPLKGEITHHGRVWVLRMWCAMQSPPRALQVVVREEAPKSSGAASVKERAGVADSVSQTFNIDEASLAGASTPPPHAEHRESAPAAAGASPSASDGPLYYASVSVVECSRAKAPAVVVLRGAHMAPGVKGTAAVAGAVHRVFFQLQRTPTIQALHRFLSRQPQLHLPSLRTLRDPDNVVHQLLRLLRASAATSTMHDANATTNVKRSHRTELSFAVPPASLLRSSGESFWTLPIYSTWPVEVLLRWVRAHGDAEVPVPADVNLPHTLAALFDAYGLVAREGATRGLDDGGGPRVFHMDSAVHMPSRLAGALGLLCRCLPSPSPSSSPGTSLTAFDAVVRGRTLPLQLAHVLLMGLLLDCVPWAVQLVAMVVCAEETLEWYADARLASQRSPSPPLPGAAPQTAKAVGPVSLYASVDVVEAVLLSADPTAPPLPASVTSYARAVSQRMSCLSTDALRHMGDAANADVEKIANACCSGVVSMHPCRLSILAQASLTHMKDANFDVSRLLSRVSMQETRVIRSLLQCAVVASAAPQEVWMRASRAEDVVRRLHNDEEEDDGAGMAHDDDDVVGTAGCVPASGEVFVFQGRRSAPFAALCVNGTDVTRTDADSRHTLSSMATCFAAFGCTVGPSAERKCATDNFTTSGTVATLSAARSPPHDAAATTAGGDKGNDEAGVEEDDTHEKDEEVEAEEVDDDRAVQAKTIDPAFFTRLLGTCVTPLASMVVGQTTARGASALRLANEDLPMLMTAFQDTVPLLVHNGVSAAALQEMGVHFRSRILHLDPFTETERNALCQIFTMPVEAVKDDGFDDA